MFLTDRIHYACGRNVLPGWTNVDGYDESFPCGEIPAEIAGTIFRLDLTGPHPFPTNHFRLGYSEDFIEHIDQREFIAFLCECYRTFQPGGVLRLSSPGLEGALRRHLRGSDWQAADVLREEAYERWWHKHFLCFAEVDTIAKHIGWRQVRELPYRRIDDCRPSAGHASLTGGSQPRRRTREMKILHLATFDAHGGAAVAALRLAEGQARSGH